MTPLTRTEGSSRHATSAVATPPPPVLAPPPLVALPPPVVGVPALKRKHGGLLFLAVLVLIALIAVVVVVLNPGSRTDRALRCESTSPGADLTNCDLAGADLSGKDLSGADLTDTKLVAADLTHANLSGADLTKADLRRADVTGADLGRARLHATRLRDIEGLTDGMLADALRVSKADLAAAAIRHNLRFESRETIVAAVARIPKGKGMREAAGYSPTSAFHPIVVLSDTKKARAAPWLRKGRGIWSAPGLRFVELVGAEARSSQTIETCQYDIHPITRYRNILKVSVFAAGSGRLVEQRTFYGSMPRACGTIESAALYSITGTTADFKGEVLPWLRAIVHPLSGA